MVGCALQSKSVTVSQCLPVSTSDHHFDRTSAFRFAPVSRSPISSHGSSSGSSPPSPRPPPRWPARWRWWRARWPFQRCTAGCPPTSAMPRPAAEGSGTLRCCNHRCGGGARTGSCWRRGAARSRSSTGYLAVQARPCHEISDWIPLSAHILKQAGHWRSAWAGLN